MQNEFGKQQINILYLLKFYKINVQLFVSPHLCIIKINGPLRIHPIQLSIAGEAMLMEYVLQHVWVFLQGRGNVCSPRLGLHYSCSALER